MVRFFFLSLNNQQDSHEFLTVLREALHDELMNNYHNPSIGQLVHGTIGSTVKCLTCEHEIKTDESFISLPLPIHRSTASNSIFDSIQNIIEKSKNFFAYETEKDVTLYECLENLLSNEQLGANGQWFCHNCHGLTDATKKLDLHLLPQVLILQLKRFTYDLTNNSKITTKVQIEEVLNLEKFVPNNHTNQSTKYNLVAVLVHIGTLASGHYTTFARHLDNHYWYHFNDKHVRLASLNEVITSDAYVLVYERASSSIMNRIQEDP